MLNFDKNKFVTMAAITHYCHERSILTPAGKKERGGDVERL